MIFAACAAFTLAILVYVFWVPADMETTPEKTRLVYLRERKDAVYENLRDLNFEYKAGKLPDADYHSMKMGLEEEAAALIELRDQPVNPIDPERGIVLISDPLVAELDEVAHQREGEMQTVIA